MSNTDSTPVEELVLAGDFHRPDDAEWHVELAKVLNRGRSEDKLLSPQQAFERLRTTTVDGIVIDPMYTRADAPGDLGYAGVAPFTRGTTVRRGQMDAWDVRALHEDPDAARTKANVAQDLERGATSVWFRLDDDAIAADDLAEVTSGIMLDLAGVVVSSRAAQEKAAEALLKVVEASAADKAKLDFTLSLDPVAEAAYLGTTPDLSKLAEWVKRVADYQGATPIVVDGTFWNNAGAGDVHEIGFVLAIAAEYVRNLIAAGLTPDEAFGAIKFRVSATTDQFSTIARLRAFRFCWNRVGEVFGVSEEKRGAVQHAVTSWREITRDDAYVNVLRGSISTFSAAVGCADSITVLPLDTAHGLPTEDSRRIARNTQIVLDEESNLGRVNDPAGGSWYVEKLTEMLAEAGWGVFQKIEAAGGFVAALASGLVQEELDALNVERTKRLRNRTKQITGVSEFPKIDEAPLEVFARPEAAPRDGIAWVRDSEVFEVLRDRVAAAPGKQVFLANLGTRRDFGGREGFASNVIHVAGLPTTGTEGGTLEEIVAAFKEANTNVAVLCSSAKVYPELAIPAAKALKEAGATKVLLAGNIKEVGADNLEEAQTLIDGTIAMGMDIVTALESVLDELGVA